MITILHKILKRGCHSLYEMVREGMHLLFPLSSIKMPAESRRFISTNRLYWQAQNKVPEKGIILVDGFFAERGHNYVLRTGMLAKAIESKTGCTPYVLFDKPAYRSVMSKNIYASFGIDKFMYIRPGLSKMISFLQALWFTFLYYMPLRNPEDLLKIQHNNIAFGDLIYDDIIKQPGNKYTLAKINAIVFKNLLAAFFYYFTYEKLFKKYRIQYVVCTHLVYVQYGLLARVALRFGANIVETNDLRMNYLKAENYRSKLIIPTYHSVCKDYFNDFFKVREANEFVVLAEKNLEQRLSGQIEQFDAKLAYKDKKPLNRQALREILGLAEQEDKPFVVIFSHVFADAPHSCPATLFQDYYDWLNQTIKAIVSIKEVNWLIKPHPSSKLYGEIGVVESLVAQYTEGCEPNVFLYPAGFSTSNLDQLATGLVTVTGTAGIEFSCLGLTVILAGKAFYSGYGFTQDPQTKEEYFRLLANIHQLPKMSSSQINKAKSIYGAYIYMKMIQSDIIQAKALDKVWGYDESACADVEAGNRLINDQLSQHDPKKEAQYCQLLASLEE